MARIIDLYMGQYARRDARRAQRLPSWAEQVGELALSDLSDDHVHAALETLMLRPSRYFAGRDADRRPVFKAKAH